MKIAEARRILKIDGGDRGHTQEGIEKFAECCDYWAMKFAQFLESQMNDTDRVYPLHVSAAFTEFIMRGDCNVEV